jgi:uncharacterized protein (TIGR00251 family)
LVDTGQPDRLPFAVTADGVAVTIRLTPKASADRIVGIERLADGTTALKVSVTAVPEKGKANKALLKLLSKSWGVGMRSLELTRGAKDRNKTVLVAGDTETMFGALSIWASRLEPPA